MKDKIIIINGLGGCGKSTFVKLSKDYCCNRWKNVRAYEISSIDFVKEVATFCGWDGSKTTKNRIFLHNLKVLLEEWDSVPDKKVFEKIKELRKYQTNSIFFINIREGYNIDIFKSLAKEQNYDCLTLIVKNPNIKTNEVPELIEQINNYKYDIIINNNKSLNHLEFLAKNFTQDLVDGKFDNLFNKE